MTRCRGGYPVPLHTGPGSPRILGGVRRHAARQSSWKAQGWWGRQFV